jgi:hypothetical protein
LVVSDRENPVEKRAVDSLPPRPDRLTARSLYFRAKQMNDIVVVEHAHVGRLSGAAGQCGLEGVFSHIETRNDWRCSRLVLQSDMPRPLNPAASGGAAFEFGSSASSSVLTIDSNADNSFRDRIVAASFDRRCVPFRT